jgi:hypothetical protein
VRRANPFSEFAAGKVERDGGNHMYATVRRYEGSDQLRSEEVTRRVCDSLLPSLRELPGFGGYYLIDAGGGVLTSVGLFETSAQAHESTRLAARWVREQKLEDALPNTPKITAGPVIACEGSGAVARTGLPRSHSAPQTPGPREKFFLGRFS